jgi:hypothetical protein
MLTMTPTLNPSFHVHVSLSVTGDCTYRQRQKCILFNKAQQCYMFRSIRSYLGINVHYLKKQVKCVKMCWNLQDLLNVTIIVTLEY